MEVCEVCMDAYGDACVKDAYAYTRMHEDAMHFHQKVNKSMNFTIHKCTINIIPVTNPTQYTKLVK